MKKISATLIISFYQKIEQLKLVLAGLEIQSFKNFEVIIADDGSQKEVVDEINKIISNFPLNIMHVWHEDAGWQKNVILNKAITQAHSDYLIFTDGDCIPHHKFVEEHFNYRNKQTILAGRRVNLSLQVTKKLSVENIKKKKLQKQYIPILFFHKILRKSKNIENGLYIRSRFLRKFINNKPNKGLLGSNFSVYKNDLLEINGFDERYKHPFVGEDTDLEYRLKKNGVTLKTVKHIAIQFHLYHERHTRPQENLDIFNDTKSKNIIFTPYGIKKQ
jgi:glycosyltransferase involved in cell wall biosynthesis